MGGGGESVKEDEKEGVWEKEGEHGKRRRKRESVGGGEGG